MGDAGAASFCGHSNPDLSQAEVEYLGRTASSHKDVGRLYVAVHDALRMGRIERISNLDSDR